MWKSVVGGETLSRGGGGVSDCGDRMEWHHICGVGGREMLAKEDLMWQMEFAELDVLKAMLDALRCTPL
jgi:hypothetical protein